MKTINRSKRKPSNSTTLAKRIGRLTRYGVCYLLPWLVASVATSAQKKSVPKSTSELKQMSLDELTNYQVTSVSKKEEKLSQAASAIQVITQEDIRRSGATSIPEALRLASNLLVAQVDSRQWAITSRGFNGTTANKLLVLIDGRTVYTPLFSGVFWDVQDTLLEDIDRIEVISGPGGTLWGANAVNGVINIITKSAKDTQGLLVAGGGGSTLHDFGGVRYGGKLGDQAFYRGYVKHFDRDSSRRPNGSDAGDAWQTTQGGFRADWLARGDNAFTLQGDAYEGAIGQLNAGDVAADGGNVIGRWTKKLSDTSSVRLQFFYDHTHRMIPGTFSEDLNTYDVDFQHRFAVGGPHDVVWGLNYRLNHDHVGNSAVLAFLPAVLTTQLFSGFVQDEITLVENRLKLTLGTKLEHNDFSGFEYQPSARLSLRFTDRQTVWAAVSRAVRTPSRIDRDLFAPAPVNLAGGPGFDSEKLLAYELGDRIQPRDDLSFSAAAFYHNYDDLRSVERTVPIVLANGLTGKAYGTELTAIYLAAPWWRLHAGYTFLQLHLHKKPGSTDISSPGQEGDSPHHQLLFRSSMDLSERVQWDAMARYVDNLPNQRIPFYWGLDSRLAYLPRKDLEFSVVGQNLLDSRHPEFGTPATRKEIQRGVYGKVTWRF